MRCDHQAKEPENEFDRRSLTKRADKLRIIRSLQRVCSKLKIQLKR